MGYLKRTMYIQAYTKNILDFVIFKQRLNRIPQNYYGKEIKNINNGSEYIANLISKNEPFCVARFGSSELGCFHNYIKIKLGFVKKFKPITANVMEKNAGFFPTEYDYLFRYSEMLEGMYSNIDLIACFNIFMEDYVINNYCEKSKLTVLKTVDPILGSWTHLLKGKKVLVVHPFADLIEKQYKKREYIFPDSNRLPEFELKTYTSIQTAAYQRDSRFQNWFEAYEYMLEDIKNIDFDIALIAAGAYGLPLAEKVKTEMNKQSIHCGGSLQLLFGIKGKRWDNRKDINCFYNEHWVRPETHHIPEKSNEIEDGCYW